MPMVIPSVSRGDIPGLIIGVPQAKHHTPGYTLYHVFSTLVRKNRWGGWHWLIGDNKGGECSWKIRCPAATIAYNLSRSTIGSPNPMGYRHLLKYVDLAYDSAREMAFERDEYFELSGQAPIGQAKRRDNFMIDQWWSTIEYMRNDLNVIAMNGQVYTHSWWWKHPDGRGPSPEESSQVSISKGDGVTSSFGRDGVYPYFPWDVETAVFLRAERKVRRAEQLAVRLLNPDGSAKVTGNARVDAASAKLAQMLRKLIPINPLLPLTAGNIDFDAMADPDKYMRLSMREALRLVNVAEADKDNIQLAMGSIADKWKSIGPAVTFSLADNPHISFGQWAEPWGLKPDPPLVRLRVVQRIKPMPKKGFLSSIFGQIIGIVISFIPVIGQIASLAWQAAQIGDKRSYVNAFQIPVSVYEPQYQPMPFYVMVPLDLAQAIVRENWFLPTTIEHYQMQNPDIEIVSLDGSFIQLPPIQPNVVGVPIQQPIDTSQFVTIDQASGFVSGADVTSLIHGNAPDISQFLTDAQISAMVNSNIPDLSDFLTEGQAQALISSAVSDVVANMTPKEQNNVNIATNPAPSSGISVKTIALGAAAVGAVLLLNKK
jgi:hypothetical protein